ncbi:melanoregulin-like [Apostichopus japonicus]|uniref:melanoregulin-like n=1 Tax=Stichopus japonicus TaxID=307972 RepID=UPI003AB3C667
MQCCLGFGRKESRDPPYTKVEQSGLLVGDTGSSKYSSVDEFLNHHKAVHSDAINLWTNPDDVTHTLEEDDRVLMTLLQESESCTSSQEREQIEKEVNKIRNERKATQKRWKGILIGLGFDQEADRLLDVHTIVPENDSSNPREVRAPEILRHLVQESNIFGHSSTQAARYIVVLDRLLDLDVADSFLLTAIRQYPKAMET